MRTDLSPKHPNSEWYEELGALAAIGELSASEFDELQRHLAECAECRRVCSDFRRISLQDLGVLAVQKGIEPESTESGRPVDEQALFARLLERMPRERAIGSDPNPSRPGVVGRFGLRSRLLRAVNWTRRPALSYAALALVLCATVGVGAYRLKGVQLSPTLTELRSQITDWRNRTETSIAEKTSAAEQLRESEMERGALRQSLREAQAKYVELQARQKALESEMAAVRAESDQKGRDLAAERIVAEEKNKQTADLQMRIQNAVQRTEEQRRLAENLRKKLEWAEQTVKIEAPAAPEGFSDVEAKNLFGARDLHIVDVYDVDSNGTTKRTYGRVYYAEKKLLIFYAFDLQDKGRNRAPAGFQAWGYRQPNENKPENLGMFSIDDASMNRWVLEFNNPRVLEHIDAVFVTLESPNGSPSPRGRRLLYANLAAPPNHP